MTETVDPPRGKGAVKLRLAIIIAFYLGVSVTLASIPADDLIDALGGNNAFVLMFVLGVVGGVTTFTGIPYHLVLMSLAAGGLSPVGLGICTAIGVMLGDSAMFFVGKHVKDSLSPRILATIELLSERLVRHPKMVTPALVAYGTFSPFSNDFVVGSLSVAGYNYWRVITPLTVGNIFYNIALAYLGLYAYDAIIDWF